MTVLLTFKILEICLQVTDIADIFFYLIAEPFYSVLKISDILATFGVSIVDLMLLNYLLTPLVTFVIAQCIIS